MSSASHPPKTILHVDINSYFATLLQQENPHLRGKPLGVLKDVGRTCIIAASKEAKKYGVETGSRLKDAKLRCPHIIAIPAAFDRYLDATKRLKTIFAAIAPDYFIYSLDEAFIDVTDCRRLYPDSLELAQNIQQQIKNELGTWVTCNVGISHNRLLAKMASEVSPKESVLTITNNNKDYYLAKTSFKDVCGVGYRLEKKLRRIGVSTPYQIRFYSEEELEPLVGSFWSKELLKIAYGEEPHHLSLIDRKLPHMKSVGRSITGYKACDDEHEIRSIIFNLLEEITYKARKMNLAGRQVSISLYGSGLKHYGFSHEVVKDGYWGNFRTLKHYTNHTQEIFDILYNQLYKKWDRSFKIIKFAVRLSMLKPTSQINPSLLPAWHQQEKMYAAMDSISNKYGLFTLRSGALLKQPIIKPEVTGFLGDREYQLGY